VLELDFFLASFLFFQSLLLFSQSFPFSFLPAFSSLLDVFQHLAKLS
jgi:hypothetical protein